MNNIIDPIPFLHWSDPLVLILIGLLIWIALVILLLVVLPMNLYADPSVDWANVTSLLERSVMV